MSRFILSGNLEALVATFDPDPEEYHVLTMGTSVFHRTMENGDHHVHFGTQDSWNAYVATLDNDGVETFMYPVGSTQDALEIMEMVYDAWVVGNGGEKLFATHIQDVLLMPTVAEYNASE